MTFYRLKTVKLVLILLKIEVPELIRTEEIEKRKKAHPQAGFEPTAFLSQGAHSTAVLQPLSSKHSLTSQVIFQICRGPNHKKSAMPKSIYPI